MTGAWQRLTVTVTTTGHHHALSESCRCRGRFPAAFNVDAVQVEQKAHATSYTDGSLGTGFTRSRNLLPSAAASFEDGTTGGYGSAGGGAALVNSADFAFRGNRSLKITSVGNERASSVTPGAARGSRAHLHRVRLSRPLRRASQ